MSKISGVLCAVCLLVVASVVQANHKPIHVVFISPGHASSDNPTGQFWPQASQFADAVADDLNIQLETLYAHRDSFRLQRLLKQVMLRQQKPDYLLLVNERFALTPLFDELDRSEIPFFLAYNHHSKGALEGQPTPRKHHRHWLGSLLPDNEYAGFKLAELLIKRQSRKPVNILAYHGDTVTSSALLRKQGLLRALEMYPEARLIHSASGEWRYDIPSKHGVGQLRRNPEINAVWAANGPMGLGALDAMDKVGRAGSLPVASINWDVDEIKALQDDRLYASVGGHFMTAGWSLVMLYDYHHGFDFVDDGGAYQQRRLFEAVTCDNLNRYLPLLVERDWNSLNYKTLSKQYTPTLSSYEFNIRRLMQP